MNNFKILLLAIILVLCSRLSWAQQFPYDKIQAGDVLLVEDRSSGPNIFTIGDWIYARTFTHIALYLGRQDGGWLTYEALNPSEGVKSWGVEGAISWPVQNWDKPGLHVAIGRVKGLGFNTRVQAVQQAYATFGDYGRTAYHWRPPLNRNFYTYGLYCSQLVWATYAPYGIDLDSNDRDYGLWFANHNSFPGFLSPTAYHLAYLLASSVATEGVFPDEIRASSNIEWYYDRTNPFTGVTYQTHVEGVGWMGQSTDGGIAGTTGQSRRMEAIRIWSPGRHIYYQAHVEGIGWMQTVSDGQVAGTTGQNRRLEALRIWTSDNVPITFYTHIQNKGWIGAFHNREDGGTTGQGLRMEAIQIRIDNH